MFCLFGLLIFYVSDFGSLLPAVISTFFFFNDTATTEIYTLSLHDALPISCSAPPSWASSSFRVGRLASLPTRKDRKSTRLNSSHVRISYAVFCLKKKKRNVISGAWRLSTCSCSHVSEVRVEGETCSVPQ